MHDIYQTRFSEWLELEAAIVDIADPLPRGDAFEELASFYFRYFALTYEMKSIYFQRVDKRPFPANLIERLGLGNRDLGIDGLYVKSDDSVVAIQVKWRTSRESLTYGELATFWSEAEQADYRLVFTNAAAISDVSVRRRGHLQVAREQLETLDSDFFGALHEFVRSARVMRPPRKIPRPYQSKALDEVAKGLDKHDRGKLIAACGIGKTLIALWLCEDVSATRILFVAPNLQLIRQTLKEWSEQSQGPFRFIAVCSDVTVVSDIDDEISNATYGSDVPITTNAEVVAEFLESFDDDAVQIVFSTYQSMNVVADATRKVAQFSFDIGIFDEAHKTAGLDTETGFGVGLLNTSLPIGKRLFMTATERLFSPRLQRSAKEAERLIFSMDNLQVYGPTLYRLTFSQAIEEGIISDYRVVVALLSGVELQRLIREHRLVIDPTDEERVDQVVRTSQIFNYTLLQKVVQSLGVKKLVSYHSRVSEAKSFAQTINERSGDGDGDSPIKGLSVSGAMSSSQRHSTIRTFEKANLAALSNARCLIEGVDIPIIDAVFFATPKRSLVDIVQAVGRALRKPYGPKAEKLAYVIIPIVTTQPNDDLDFSSSEFDRLFDVVQALRDQDDRIADQIDTLNLELSKGRPPPGGSRPPPVMLIVPGLLDVQELERALSFRIAEVNSRPTGVRFVAGELGRGERGSSIPRLLRTMGDYTVTKYHESLVDPTLALMKPDRLYERKAIRINNNNVAHSEKLGVISGGRGDGFAITEIGRMYLEGERSFSEVFRNQMLLFRDSQAPVPAFYPYRLVAQVLLELGSMNFFEFLYGVYALDTQIPLEQALAESIQRGLFVRSLGIKPEVANETSRKEILKELTEVTEIKFKYNDVWTDRTTTGNQFRYFGRHLELFEDVFERFDFKQLRLVRGGRKMRQHLNQSQAVLGEELYGRAWWLPL